jgi:hypothetical protein
MQVRVISQKGLNIREKPDLESDIIEKVPQGALLEADEITWAHIALPDGREGWAASQRAADKYLERVAAETPASEEETVLPSPAPVIGGTPHILLQSELARVFNSPPETYLSADWKAWAKRWVVWIDLSPWADQLRHVKGLWQGGKCGFWGNKILQGPINKVFGKLAERGLLHELQTFEGCWCVRPMKGGTRLTVHSWALALDFNAATNPFGGGCTWSDAFLQTWTECGWETGAAWDPPGTDAMHFQWAWTRDWTEYEADPFLPKVEGRA